jgi:hypothetical protein
LEFWGDIKRVHLCNQESEAAKLDEEWCTLALKQLKEASPLALKVSLRSVSRKSTPRLCALIRWIEIAFGHPADT